MPGTDCLFCKIIDGKIPSPRLFEDEDFIVIKDIQPQAKTHLLVLPRKHLASLEAAFPEKGSAHSDLMGRLLETGARVARDQGLLPGGFRAVLNTGPHAGQTVFHIHLHILGGEPLDGFGA
ncbi:MAG: histidine triad nucleotide-binding protein [Bdellovibrionota bacterium]